jgi:Resolvase, N terminal domain
MNVRGLASLPWGIYARLSDDKGAEQTATARQIADCRRLAADRGWAVAEAHVYEDVDLSAFKRSPAPTGTSSGCGRSSSGAVRSSGSPLDPPPLDGEDLDVAEGRRRRWTGQVGALLRRTRCPSLIER